MLLLGSIRSIMRRCIRTDNVLFRKPTRPSLPFFENLPVLPYPFSKTYPSFLTLFRKSPRPSFLIKQAALGNLKASFHCTHWHRFFPLKRAPPLTPTLSPSGEREETALLGARNRYALRLADHQRSRQIVRDGTAWILQGIRVLFPVLLPLLLWMWCREN